MRGHHSLQGKVLFTLRDLLRLFLRDVCMIKELLKIFSL